MLHYCECAAYGKRKHWGRWFFVWWLLHQGPYCLQDSNADLEPFGWNLHIINTSQLCLRCGDSSVWPILVPLLHNWRNAACPMCRSVPGFLSFLFFFWFRRTKCTLAQRQCHYRSFQISSHNPGWHVVTGSDLHECRAAVFSPVRSVTSSMNKNTLLTVSAEFWAAKRRFTTQGADVRGVESLTVVEHCGSKPVVAERIFHLSKFYSAPNSRERLLLLIVFPPFPSSSSLPPSSSSSVFPLVSPLNLRRCDSLCVVFDRTNPSLLCVCYAAAALSHAHTHTRTI